MDKLYMLLKENKNFQACAVLCQAKEENIKWQNEN